MNKQLIKIILFDIKSNLLSCLLLTFQMIVAFFVIGDLCSITAYKTVTVNVLDGFDFPKNCYSPSNPDIYTDGGIVVDYDDIEKERNLSYYIAENYKTEGRSEFYEEKDGTEYTLSVITEHYFDIFGFEVSKGRLFQNTEYGKDLSDNPPVVLGSDFENDYNIGDLYLDKYEVVGILKSGMKTTFLQGDKSSVVSADNKVFTPVMSIESMKAQGIDYPTSLIYADDKSDLAAINDYAAENGMNTYNFISADETRKLIDLVSTKANISLIVISSIIIILAVFSMIQSTLLYVRKNIRELLIHMICGASQSDILLRISAEVLIINLVGVVVSSLIFMSLRTTLVFMLTGIATAVIAVVPVMVSIKRKPLIMQIKEEK